MVSGLYEGCIDNSIEVFDIRTNIFIQKLEKEIDKIKNKYNYVVIDISHSISCGGRIVLYNGDIPGRMVNYKNKWIIKDNRWIRQGLLGICDVCKQEKELVCLCDKGCICADCDDKL